ncbi:MAG: ABC transporter ATP-binding protein, partial [Lentisphaeraceae bacterium]|nr:ABC transporter ATP-binding protein [Lentisphaeraceae bacterium]
IVLLPLALAGLAVLRWLFSFIKIYYQGKLGQDVLQSIRQQIYKRVQSFPFEYHDHRHSGTLIANLVEDVRFATMFFEQAIFLLIESAAFVITVYIFLFMHNASAAWASLSLFTCGLLGACLVYTKSFFVYGRTKELFAQKVSMFTESMEGQLVVRAYGQKKMQIDKYKKRVQAMHRSNFNEIQWEVFSNQILLWSVQIGTPLVILAYLWNQRSMGMEVSGGTIVLIFTSQALLLGKSRQLSRGIDLLMRFAITARRLDDFFHSATNGDDDKSPAPQQFNEIVFNKVSFAYGERQQVLQNISFNLTRGQILGLAGSTGAGKSSLAHLIAGFYPINSGSIQLNGVDIQSFNPRKLRRHIAIVFQETFLFAGSIRDNIAFGTPDCDLDRIKQVAGLAHADEFIEDLKDGYDTEVGEKGISLSGGQRQRIGIARALIHNPQLLILDSCTSALDTNTEQAILQSLRELDSTMTVIISHRRSALNLCDKILLLEKGLLIEQGTPQQLNQPGSRYLQVMEVVNE